MPAPLRMQKGLWIRRALKMAIFKAILETQTHQSKPRHPSPLSSFAPVSFTKSQGRT